MTIVSIQRLRVAALWLLLALAMVGCAHTKAEPAGPSAEELTRTWGIRVEGARWSARGRVIDFRYRVIDAEKAAPLFERQTKPVLIDLASGARMPVATTAKLGTLRHSGTPRVDKTYAVLFANFGGAVRPGSAVAIEIGDLRLDRLVIQ